MRRAKLREVLVESPNRADEPVQSLGTVWVRELECRGLRCTVAWTMLARECLEVGELECPRCGSPSAVQRRLVVAVADINVPRAIVRWRPVAPRDADDARWRYVPWDPASLADPPSQI